MSPQPKRSWVDERGLHASGSSPQAKRLRSMEGGVSGAASSAAQLAALIRERRRVVRQLLEGRRGGFSFTDASGGASDGGGENVVLVQQQQGESEQEQEEDDGDATQAAVPASSPHSPPPPPAHLPSPPASLGTSAWPTQDDGAQVLLLSGGSSLPAVFRLSQMQHGGGAAAEEATAAADPTPSTQGGGGRGGSFGCRMRSVACAEVASSLDRQQQAAAVAGPLPAAAAGAAASAAFLYDTPLEDEGSAGGDASVSAWSGSERTPVCIRTAAPPLPLRPQPQQPPSAAVASAQPRQPQTPTQQTEGEPCSAGLLSPHPQPQRRQPAAPPSEEEVAATPLLLAGLWPSGGGLSAPHEWRINNSRPLRSIGAATGGATGNTDALGEVSGWGGEEEGEDGTTVVATSCSVAATRPCVAVVGLSNGAVRGFLAAPGCPTVFALPPPPPPQSSSSSTLPATCPAVRAAHLLPWFAAHVVVAVAYADRVVRVPLVARLPVFAVSPAEESCGRFVALRVPPSPPTLRREIASLSTVASEAAPLLAATVVTVSCAGGGGGGSVAEELVSAEVMLFDHATGATLARVAMPPATPALPLPLRSVAAQPFRLGDGTLGFLWGTPRGVARTAGVAAPLPLLLPPAAAAPAAAAAEATDVVTPAGVLRQVRACGAGEGEGEEDAAADAAAVVRAWAATPDGRYTASSVGSSLYFHATGTGALTAAIDLAGGGGAGDQAEKYVHAVAFHPTLVCVMRLFIFVVVVTPPPYLIPPPLQPLMCLADSEGSVWVYRSTDQPYA